jgi:hypothetical protein
MKRERERDPCRNLYSVGALLLGPWCSGHRKSPRSIVAKNARSQNACHNQGASLKHGVKGGEDCI